MSDVAMLLLLAQFIIKNVVREKKDKRSLECKYSLVYSFKQKDTANSKNTGN